MNLSQNSINILLVNYGHKQSGFWVYDELYEELLHYKLIDVSIFKLTLKGRWIAFKTNKSNTL